MHSWLPSYANFPQKLLNQSPFLSFCYFLSICSPGDAPYKSLMTIRAGKMIEKPFRKDTSADMNSYNTLAQGTLKCDWQWSQNSKLVGDHCNNIYTQIRHNPTNSIVKCRGEPQQNENLTGVRKQNRNSKPINLVANPCKGQIALVCTNDGRRQMKLLWWEVSNRKTQQMSRNQNMFMATSSDTAHVCTCPDLEIEIIPNQCTISAAENSQNRVLVVECHHCGTCKSEPKHKR